MTRCGIVALIGRPNVGKSTLVNELVGTKVTITARTPHTTRRAVRGVLTENGVQLILVDTPGLHRPRTSLGSRLNESARAATDGVDGVVAVLDARADVGPGDRQVLAEMLDHCRVARPAVVLNKVDHRARGEVAARLVALGGELETLSDTPSRRDALGRVEYFAVSARRGEGTQELLDFLISIVPEGPYLFPDEEVSDVEEATWIAELVREQLLRHMRDELPHAIHCRVKEIAWPRVVVEILVERESQKGMVIGARGQLLKDVGSAARREMPDGTYLELRVAVESGWQQRTDLLDRFGY